MRTEICSLKSYLAGWLISFDIFIQLTRPSYKLITHSDSGEGGFTLWIDIHEDDSKPLPHSSNHPKEGFIHKNTPLLNTSLPSTPPIERSEGSRLAVIWEFKEVKITKNKLFISDKSLKVRETEMINEKKRRNLLN